MARRRLEAGVGGGCPLVVQSVGQLRLNHESDFLLMINDDQPSCNEGTNNGEDHKPECKVQESLLWMVNKDYRIFL